MCLILDANMSHQIQGPSQRRYGASMALVAATRTAKSFTLNTEKFRNEWEQRGGEQLMRELLQDEGLSSSSVH